MSFIKKLQSNKKIKDMVSSDVGVSNVDEFYHSGSITLNLLLSGKVNGGVPKGKVTMLAAPRASMKTIITMISAANAQKKGNTVVWIDAEFAFDPNTFIQFGGDIGEDKFILIQENRIEEIQTFVLNLFEEYNPKEDGGLFIAIDSLGTMITSKTVDDSMDGKDVQDMTQAKKRNSLASILLMVSGKKNVTIVMINHLYAGMSQYDTGVISGGSKSQYVASSILKITSRAKEKDKEGDVEGNIFTANTEKGRFSRENSKLKFKASYNDGINAFYGLLDDALEGGYVTKPTVGWYTRPHIAEDKKFREADIYCSEFWKPVFGDTDFKQYLETKYSYTNTIDGVDNLYDTAELVM